MTLPAFLCWRWQNMQTFAGDWAWSKLHRTPHTFRWNGPHHPWPKIAKLSMIISHTRSGPLVIPQPSEKLLYLSFFIYLLPRVTDTTMEIYLPCFKLPTLHQIKIPTVLNTRKNTQHIKKTKINYVSFASKHTLIYYLVYQLFYWIELNKFNKTFKRTLETYPRPVIPNHNVGHMPHSGAIRHCEELLEN